MVSIQVKEKFTTERTVEIDPDDTGFYAWIMFDNHTFTKTKPGFKESVYTSVLQVRNEDPPMFALFSLHHEALDGNTKLVTSTDIQKILEPETWNKPHNPFGNKN